MAQNTIVQITAVLDRYNAAAAQLATAVDAIDRIATDHTYPAERSPSADEYRAARLADALAEFRYARADLLNLTAERELRRPSSVHPVDEDLEPGDAS